MTAQLPRETFASAKSDNDTWVCRREGSVGGNPLRYSLASSFAFKPLEKPRAGHQRINTLTRGTEMWTSRMKRIRSSTVERSSLSNPKMKNPATKMPASRIRLICSRYHLHEVWFSHFPQVALVDRLDSHHQEAASAASL